MPKFLISHYSGDEISGSTNYYRFEYSSKEKLIDDFNKAGQEAIDKKEYSFLFLNERFFLESFNYGYYDEEDEDRVFNVASKVITLDEWFFEREILKEGTPNIEKPVVSNNWLSPVLKRTDNEQPFGKFTLILPSKKEIVLFYSNKENLMESLFYNAKKAKLQGEKDFEFFGLNIDVDSIVNYENEKTNYSIK